MQTSPMQSTRKIEHYTKQACSKLVNKLEQCCYFIKLLQGCHSQLVDQIVEWQDDVRTTCNKSVELNNLVTSCQQTVDNLSASWEQAVRTYPVDKLLNSVATSLLQVCYNLCVRFYVCVQQQGQISW